MISLERQGLGFLDDNIPRSVLAIVLLVEACMEGIRKIEFGEVLCFGGGCGRGRGASLWVRVLGGNWGGSGSWDYPVVEGGKLGCRWVVNFR